MKNNRPNEAITITCPGEYTVYGHQFDGKVEYIGQTEKTFEERLKDGYPNNPELEKKLKGEHETFIIMEGISSRHADARERLNIAKYGTLVTMGGYNRQTGGKSGYEVIRRDSQAVIATKIDTGEEIRFPSVTWASKATGAQTGHIYEVMHDIRHSASGYRFRPADLAELFPEDCEGQ